MAKIDLGSHHTFIVIYIYFLIFIKLIVIFFDIHYTYSSFSVRELLMKFHFIWPTYILN